MPDTGLSPHRPFNRHGGFQAILRPDARQPSLIRNASITRRHTPTMPTHPTQYGSGSIKALLSIAAPDLNYGDLEGVHDGAEAQAAYVEAIDPATDDAKRKVLEKNMLAYCALDTLAMVRLVGFVGRETA